MTNHTGLFAVRERLTDVVVRERLVARERLPLKRERLEPRDRAEPREKIDKVDPVSIIDLEDGKCRWAVTHDKPFLFCGKATKSSKDPYCRTHHRLAVDRRLPELDRLG